MILLRFVLPHPPPLPPMHPPGRVKKPGSPRRVGLGKHSSCVTASSRLSPATLFALHILGVVANKEDVSTGPQERAGVVQCGYREIHRTLARTVRSLYDNRHMIRSSALERHVLLKTRLTSKREREREREICLFVSLLNV